MPNVSLIYQYFMVALLVAWVVPLLTVWTRYEDFPHQKYLLLATFTWPLTLVDEWLRAFGGVENWFFVAGVFQFLPVLICTWLLLATHQLLFEKPLKGVWKYYIPTGILFLGEIPFLVTKLTDKVALFSSPPTGDLLSNWIVYLPVMFLGFAMLALAVQGLEWLSNYNQSLSEQVVDVNFYRFKGLNGGFMLTVLASFFAIVVTALAVFDLGMPSIWLSMIDVLFALSILLNLVILMVRRRYSPTPIEAGEVNNHHYSDEFLRQTLQKAERAIIKHKAYKRIGLRIRQLADIAEVEPVALAIATRSILNRNFRAFIYHYRLEYAKKILMQTDVKVSSVAKRLGFNSEKFLSDVFIKYIKVMGRDQHRAEEDELFR